MACLSVQGVRTQSLIPLGTQNLIPLGTQRLILVKYQLDIEFNTIGTQELSIHIKKWGRNERTQHDVFQFFVVCAEEAFTFIPSPHAA